MLCPHCYSVWCKEDCVDFCINCDEPIGKNEEYCSDRCQRLYESNNE